MNHFKAKRKLHICLVLIMALVIGSLFTACTGRDSHTTSYATEVESGDALQIVTTIFPPYDFACQVAGGYADVTMLLQPGAEAHSYEPTPQDIILISQCDIFIYNGGDSDAWVDDVLESIDNPDMIVVKMMDCVDLYEEETTEGMMEEATTLGESEEEEEEEYDEHVWASPVNAMAITEAIAEAMGQADPDHKEIYDSNCASYISQLEDLDSQIREIVANGKRKTLVFGDRFPLRYFVEEYGLDYYAAFPGCASETEASVSTVTKLVDIMRDQDIPVVFYIEMSNGEMAETIAQETGAEALEFQTCHSISKKDFQAGETYLSLMTKNLEVLEEALN